MANLKDFYSLCDKPIIPGTDGELLFAPVAEFTAYPPTKADNGGTAAGDKKTLDAPWAFVATTGLGFWRRLRILVDSGELKELGEGEVGFLTTKQRVPFFIKGSGAAVNEYVDDLLACSGCVIAMIRTKSGDHHVLGDLKNPVYFEAFEGGVMLDKVGYPMSAYVNTGKTSMVYDADTHGINYTPNP